MATAEQKKGKKTQRQDIVQNPWTYFGVTVLGAFGFYNWSGFSLYHWIANFSTRAKELGGVFPKELYPMLSLTAAIALLIIGIYRFSKTKELPVFWLGATAVAAFLTTLLSADALKLTMMMIAESFFITMAFLILLAGVGTVLIRAIKNYLTLNPGYQLIPLVFIVPTILFLWWWNRGHSLTPAIVGTSAQIAVIPVVTIGYLLAKFSRKSSGTLVGSMGIHDVGSEAAEELMASHDDDHHI